MVYREMTTMRSGFPPGTAAPPPHTNAFSTTKRHDHNHRNSTPAHILYADPALAMGQEATLVPYAPSSDFSVIANLGSSGVFKASTSAMDI